MSRRPLILHVFPSFNIGGAQVRTIALIDRFGDTFSHQIVAIDGNYGAASLLPPGADVRLGGFTARAGSLFRRLAQYRREIAARAPDLLVTYNWGAIEWAMANAVAGIPHIQIEDGFGPEEKDRQIPRRVWTRRLTLWRSEIVVPSRQLWNLATKVWRLPEKRVHYIPNGIEPQDHPSAPVADLGLNLPEGLCRIAWAGALRREKNLIRLLRAFAPLKDKAVLLVIGDGPERRAVLEEAERLSLGSSIRLLGRREDVRDILMRCDVMALSSDTEQMPLVVLEAMDAGLAIASTDVGDVGHMVCAENRPYVAERSDAALGRAMAALVLDAGLRRKIGAANREQVRRKFLAGDMTQSYRTLFLDTAGLPR